jgi:hypothetical protein
MEALEIVVALRGRWFGSYGSARCPAHDDRNPSLSVTEKTGKLLVKCHAGCSQEAVVTALKERTQKSDVWWRDSMTSTSPSSPYRLYVSPALDRVGKPRTSLRGPLYTASFEGEIIASTSAQPLFDACHILHGRGYQGPIEMWDHFRPYPRMRSMIETAAALTVEEGEGPPRFRKWKPMAFVGRSARRDQNAGKQNMHCLSPKLPKSGSPARRGGLEVTRF